MNKTDAKSPREKDKAEAKPEAVKDAAASKMNERYILIVSLWLRNNDVSAFEAFERQAAKAMATFDGRIERAIRISGTVYEGDSPFEIHIVSFPSEAAFQMYRQSSESTNLAQMRGGVILKTVVLAGSEVNVYA